MADTVFDCTRPAALARFWAEALDGHRVAPYDQEGLSRLQSIGVHDIDDDPTVLVEPRMGGGPRIWFQSVPEPKQVKNRVHLDLRTTGFDGELARPLGLGARMVEVRANQDLVVLADPEGNEFCLLRP